jgi:hypothetical protein
MPDINPESRASSLAQGIINPPANRAVVLRNVTCGYCGKPFDAKLASTKEHVIGRRFVPKGVFAGQWNLILNACGPCNGAKADLENDISIITMMPDVMGHYAVDDERIRAEVSRKAAKAISRRTRKAVQDSQEHLQVQANFGPALFTFNLVGPAQVDEARIFELAYFHFRGLFYWITYQPEQRRGGFVLGGFYPMAAVRRSDWGAANLRWFMTLIKDWDLRVHAIGADGFFKVLIRRHPQGKPVWCWAVEWNCGMRVVGFAGDRAAVDAVVQTAPSETAQLLHQDGEDWIRYRTETPLPEADDDLFSLRVGIDFPS